MFSFTFVASKRSMPQNDVYNGGLMCGVGVAPLKPAEFGIFGIGQKRRIGGPVRRGNQ
jgi:hypothetical protein